MLTTKSSLSELTYDSISESEFSLLLSSVSTLDKSESEIFEIVSLYFWLDCDFFTKGLFVNSLSDWLTSSNSYSSESIGSKSWELLNLCINKLI